MRILLQPPGERRPGMAAYGAIALLTVSAISLLVAPTLLPKSYSWVSRGTSESAAQGMEGAWLARFGFLAFGLAVLWLSAIARSVWPRGAVWSHMGFGVCMVAAAAFSTRPWMAGASYDPVEDMLHSWAANTMGIAFALGVLLRLFQRGKGDRVGAVVDGVAVVAATLIPIVMVSSPGVYGVAQRLMFLIAYVWYGWEAARRGSPRGEGLPSSG